MSDRYGSYPPDEPVIGANYPPAPSPSGYQQQPEYIGAGDAWAPSGTGAAAPDQWAPTPVGTDDPYAGEYDEYDEDYDDYGDGYGDESPARQPMFYVFIAMAVLIGGGLIFLLFALFGGNGDDPEVGFRVSIGTPEQNERVHIDTVTDVTVSATSSEEITQFELFVDDRSVDQMAVTAPGADNVYSGTLHYTFDRAGEYELFVRVKSVSGATEDSEKIKVVAIQPVGDRPVEIKGRVIGTASVREGPGESFDVIRTLTAGEEVTIIGKTRDGSWLLLDGDQGWVRKEAIEPLESLALVPVKDPTPTQEPTPEDTATPIATPTVSPNAPDFVPANALLIDGGDTLRITVQNLASAPYEGPLVVGVSNVGVTSPQVAVDVNIPANGSVTVDFELDPPITSTGSTVQVTVDPGNAVEESSEDNNNATFVLTPAAEAPDLIVLEPSYSGGEMNITIRNDGGQFNSSTLVVRVESGGSASEQSRTVAMAKGEEEHFTFAKPAAGDAKIRVLVNGVQLTAADVQVP